MTDFIGGWDKRIAITTSMVLMFNDTGLELVLLALLHSKYPVKATNFSGLTEIGCAQAHTNLLKHRRAHIVSPAAWRPGSPCLHRVSSEMRRIALNAFSHHFVFDQLVVDVVSWRLKAQKNSDCFSYQVTFKFQVDTKRKTLSETPRSDTSRSCK